MRTPDPSPLAWTTPAAALMLPLPPGAQLQTTQDGGRPVWQLAPLRAD